MTNTPIKSAMQLIKDEGLDRIRCSLTGAPYATLDEDEIRLALNAEALQRKDNATADSLVDAWHLKALALNSNPCPALRNAGRFSLSTILQSGRKGRTRVIIYCLSRLFFPPQHQVKGIYTTSSRAIERMLFASRLFDSMAQTESDDLLSTTEADARLDAWVQKLSACDSYCALTRWQEMTLWTAKRANEGIHAKKNQDVARWIVAPDLFDATPEQMERLIEFLFTLMIDSAQKETALPADGNKLTNEVFIAQSEALPVTRKIVQREKSFSEQLAEYQAQQQWERTLNESAQLKVAWSATHGKGVAMGAPAPQSKRKAKGNKRGESKQFKSGKANAMVAALARLNLK